MKVRKIIRKKKVEGFTLVELMIVIAIIAILAAVAITQYSSYKKKAKAKDLIGFARACVMEIATQCQVDNNTAWSTLSALEACTVSSQDTDYITGISVTTAGTGCNNATATATGTVDGTSYSATCSFDGNDITCGAPS